MFIFLNCDQVSNHFKEFRGKLKLTFYTLRSRKVRYLKGNFCIYKCFIDVLYIFDRVFKKKWEMRPI